MKLSRWILVAVLATPLIFAQTDEERKRVQEIQQRRARGEQISLEDQKFVQGVQARMREAFVKTHPPQDSTGVVALPDLGAGMYKGEQGGLYPGGKNEPPAGHLAAGLKLSREIVPLDREGQPERLPLGASGHAAHTNCGGPVAPGTRVTERRIVLLSVGMSNTTMEFQTFQQKAAADPDINPCVQVVDGAQGGQTARVTANPSAHYWEVDDQRLEAAGVTPKQVEVVWFKQANAGPTAPFPTEAKRLEEDIVATLHNLHDRFPNLKIAYFSSRIYAGYATSPLNPEPHAYETAFSVKWAIADQIAGKPELNYDPGKGEVRAPWLAWGPYLWTDGVKGRKMDNVIWLKDDVVESDRTHPSPSGREKVASMLLQFLKHDPTSRAWFLKK